MSKGIVIVHADQDKQTGIKLQVMAHSVVMFSMAVGPGRSGLGGGKIHDDYWSSKAAELGNGSSYD